MGHPTPNSTPNRGLSVAQQADQTADVWEAGLPAFDLHALPAFYNDASQAGRDVGVELDDNRRMVRPGGRRAFLNALAVANASKCLVSLPADGEALHVVMKGNFAAWDLIPAVLQLAAPAKCSRLYIATLGFNERVTHELLELLDTGAVGEVAFVASCYFRSTSGELYGPLHRGLTERGQKCLAVRNHAKIVLFELSDGRRFVIESSANLRSCRNVEAFCLTHAVDLHEFHKAWLDDVIAAAEKEAPK